LNGNSHIICKKCLIEGLDQEKCLKSLKGYIDALPQGAAADDETYYKRLELCENCNKIKDGICSLCGCFVIFRAKLAAKDCPDLPHKWEAKSD
jgi:hypothetical protein